MSFRAINQKYLEPGSQVLMVLGIIALCQPWNFFLHRYGVTIIAARPGHFQCSPADPARG